MLPIAFTHARHFRLMSSFRTQEIELSVEFAKVVGTNRLHVSNELGKDVSAILR